MSLFDSVLSGALSGLTQAAGTPGGGGQPALIEAAMHLLNDPQHGGLAGLIQSFEQAGLGAQAGSWVGSGQNLSISADDIQKVLGDTRLGALAQQYGITPQMLATGLAQVLPQLIDHLTPNGQMPASNALIAEGLSLLKGKLFG